MCDRIVLGGHVGAGTDLPMPSTRMSWRSALTESSQQLLRLHDQFVDEIRGGPLPDETDALPRPQGDEIRVAALSRRFTQIS